MDLGSPENGLGELNDLLREDVSSLAGELDPNFIVNKEENTADYTFDNLASSIDFSMDVNDNGQQDPPCLPCDFSYFEFSRSPEKFQSPLQTGFDTRILKETKFVSDDERLQLPSKDYYHQEETDELCGSYLSRSSFQVESETLHFNFGAELSGDLLESISKDEASDLPAKDELATSEFTHQEVEEEASDLPAEKLDSFLKSPVSSGENESQHNHYSRNSPANDRKLESEQRGSNSYKEVEDELATSELTYKEVEDEASDLPAEKLDSFLKSPMSNDESEHNHYSRSSLTDNRRLEMLNSRDLLSPKRSPQASKPPEGLGQISFTHDLSPHAPLTPASPNTFASKRGLQDLSSSSRSNRQKHCSSPERSDHSLPSARKTSSSPRRSQQGVLHMKDTSVKHFSLLPRNHGSHQNHRRRDKSASKSPTRQKGSSSRDKSEYNGRSRSRSPYRRNYHRRSPRRRYSPRRRSPPSNYHSYHRSPRRRAWSPPHNRSTGLGKPGRNLFVAGFSFLTTERDLERKFSRFGRVRDVRIVRDKRSGDSRGFGFLSLDRDEEADAAIRALDKTEWNGRVVLVEKSKPH